MIKIPSDNTEQNSTEPPAPEVLQAQSNEKKAAVASLTSRSHLSSQFRHTTHRPSHKATFIGLAVVVTILSINAAVIAFIIKGQEKTSTATKKSEVVISTDVLGKLGVSRNPIDNSGTELNVGPDANFLGAMTVAKDVNIAGQLNLNGKLSASSMSLTNIQAGTSAFNSLNVNGDGTISNLNVRKDLTVEGLTKLQGAVTVSQLLTVNNSVNILGNLSIGGILSMNNFQTNMLTVGGKITTRGSSPSVSKGSGLEAIDTVSISGNDVAGTVAVNTGAGNLRGGILANISFVNAYSTTPHVVVTAIGAGVDGVYVNRSSTGFSIGAISVSPAAGHAFDYIVMQ